MKEKNGLEPGRLGNRRRESPQGRQLPSIIQFKLLLERRLLFFRFFPSLNKTTQLARILATQNLINRGTQRVVTGKIPCHFQPSRRLQNAPVTTHRNCEAQHQNNFAKQSAHLLKPLMQFHRQSIRSNRPTTNVPNYPCFVGSTTDVPTCPPELCCGRICRARDDIPVNVSYQNGAPRPASTPVKRIPANQPRRR